MDTTDQDKLQGVRDGFARAVREGLEMTPSVVVHSTAVAKDISYVAVTEQQCLQNLVTRLDHLRERTQHDQSFCICAESGIQSTETASGVLHFLRTWVGISGPLGHSIGGSGALQLPNSVVEGDAGRSGQSGLGTRRRGGMATALTGGLESRRSTTAEATFRAGITLLFRSPDEPPGDS